MKTVAEVLRGAVTVLDERGWAQNIFEDAEGHCCTMGALHVATVGAVFARPSNEQARVITRAMYRLGEVIGVQKSISRWNDEPGRTVDEVKAALLAAAERAEASQ